MRLLLVSIALTLLLPAVGTTQSSDYERGTVIAVARHQYRPEDGQLDIARYDVAVQIRNTIYTVLYTPPNGANSVEYAAGMDFLFLVKDKTLTFPSKPTGTTTVPILRTETAPASKSGLDWSKAPSQYFTMKMQHLSESLNLTDEQRAKVKPIAEQDAGEAGQVCFTSVIPRKRAAQPLGKDRTCF